MRGRNITALKNTNKIIMVMFLGFLFLPIIGYSQSRDVNTLIERLKDKDHYVHGAAAISLGGIKEVRVVEALVAALKDETAYVRTLAAVALGETKDARGVEPLIGPLKDENKEVRVEAVKALGQIKDGRAADPLIAALKDKNYDVRWAAETALERIGEPAVGPLIGALGEKDPSFRRSVAKALGEIKDARAVEVLIAALRDKNLEIVAGAYAFFIRRGEPGTKTILIEALNNYGNSSMAADFLNSGDSQLTEAGRNWATIHNYNILQLPPGVGGGPKWGK